MRIKDDVRGLACRCTDARGTGHLMVAGMMCEMGGVEEAQTSYNAHANKGYE